MARSRAMLGVNSSTWDFPLIWLGFPPIVTDETRAGERGASPFELLEMLSGEGTCDLGHIPRVVLWRFGWALSSSNDR